MRRRELQGCRHRHLSRSGCAYMATAHGREWPRGRRRRRRSFVARLKLGQEPWLRDGESLLGALCRPWLVALLVGQGTCPGAAKCVWSLLARTPGTAPCSPEPLILCHCSRRPGCLWAAGRRGARVCVCACVRARLSWLLMLRHATATRSGGTCIASGLRLLGAVLVRMARYDYYR